MKEVSLDDIIPNKYLKQCSDENNILVYRNKSNIQYNEQKNYVQKSVFTTVVRVKGSNLFNVVPIKTDKPISMERWIDISKALSRLRVGPPLKIGDVICKNILNTGVDIICTRNITRE